MKYQYTNSLEERFNDEVAQYDAASQIMIIDAFNYWGLTVGCPDELAAQEVLYRADNKMELKASKPVTARMGNLLR